MAATLKYTAVDWLHVPTDERNEIYREADTLPEIAGLRMRWAARAEDRKLRASYPPAFNMGAL